MTVDNLPTFGVMTASPGGVLYPNAVVVTKGGIPGQVTVTLSAAADVPINVQVSLEPTGYQN